MFQRNFPNTKQRQARKQNCEADSCPAIGGWNKRYPERENQIMQDVCLWRPQKGGPSSFNTCIMRPLSRFLCLYEPSGSLAFLFSLSQNFVASSTPSRYGCLDTLLLYIQRCCAMLIGSLRQDVGFSRQIGELFLHCRPQTGPHEFSSSSLKSL